WGSWGVVISAPEPRKPRYTRPLPAVAPSRSPYDTEHHEPGNREVGPEAAHTVEERGNVQGPHGPPGQRTQVHHGDLPLQSAPPGRSRPTATRFAVTPLR